MPAGGGWRRAEEEGGRRRADGTVFEEDTELEDAAEDVDEEAEGHGDGGEEEVPGEPVGEVVQPHGRHGLPQLSLPLHQDLADLDHKRKHGACRRRVRQWIEAARAQDVVTSRRTSQEEDGRDLCFECRNVERRMGELLEEEVYFERLVVQSNDFSIRLKLHRDSALSVGLLVSSSHLSNC
jgi:hypothetical protein